MKLTSRMGNWISALGVHIASSSKKGFPVVTVAEQVSIDGEKISIELSHLQVKQIRQNIEENPVVALAPGHLGAIRAPYQFKGSAALSGYTLTVTVQEIYCTKPGAEAGVRLDTLGYDKMRQFDESRWTDQVPNSPVAHA